MTGDKNWWLNHGENYIEICHTYPGPTIPLTAGSTYSIRLSFEGAAALAEELGEGL